MAEKVCYLNEFGTGDKEERRRFLRLVSALDSAYVAHHLERMKNERKAEG